MFQLNFHDQPDQEKHTAQETTSIIANQVWVACRGVAQPVSDLQTETGIKDKTAQFWIGQALKRSSDLVRVKVTDSSTRDLRLNSRHCSKEEKKQIREILKSGIQEETYKWLITQPESKWNQLPDGSCMSLLPIVRLSLY